MPHFSKLNFVMMLLLILAGVPLLGTVAPLIEEKIYPVLGDLKEDVARNNKSITVFSTVTKARSCRVELAVFDFKTIDGYAVAVQTNPNFNRSNGGLTVLSRVIFCHRRKHLRVGCAGHFIINAIRFG
ncbi:MAG: hypothetical protein U5K75_02415 [Ahrensia sp.]|nr:hypothetical protein [Ahrensia sp.]